MNLIHPPKQDAADKQSKSEPTTINSGKGTDTIIFQSNSNEKIKCRLTLVDGKFYY